MTATELAACLGVSRMALWRWETDRGAPRAMHLLQLSRILAIPPEDMVGAIGIDTGDSRTEPPCERTEGGKLTATTYFGGVLD
jgi:transcriptional regulator with XRE-family HTH domain